MRNLCPFVETILPEFGHRFSRSVLATNPSVYPWVTRWPCIWASESYGIRKVWRPPHASTHNKNTFAFCLGSRQCNNGLDHSDHMSRRRWYGSHALLGDHRWRGNIRPVGILLVRERHRKRLGGLWKRENIEFMKNNLTSFPSKNTTLFQRCINIKTTSCACWEVTQPLNWQGRAISSWKFDLFIVLDGPKEGTLKHCDPCSLV